MKPLDRNALAQVPMTVEAVERVYADARMPTIGTGQLKRLCESHERLRMEFEGLQVLTKQGVDAIGPPSVHATCLRVPHGWAWMVYLVKGKGEGLQESGVCASVAEAAARMAEGIKSLDELGHWKD